MHRNKNYINLKMILEEYKNKTEELESLLRKLTDVGKLNKNELLNLDKISEHIAEFKEVNFPFKPKNLKEMIGLGVYQKKLTQQC